ncbi:MAG: ABC transporter permease [Thermoanaerobaculia bacterium]
MKAIVQDVRFGVRRILKHPVVAVSIVLSLALGLGANVAIFSVFSAAILRPLPFKEDSKLTRVYIVPDKGNERISLRPEVFLPVRDEVRSFESVVGQRFMSLGFETEEGPERVVGIGVTEGWSSTLGIEPQLGRSFSNEEEAGGLSSGVVLISHGTWQRRFGADEEILEKQVSLAGSTYSVIGVMPAGMAYPYAAEFWLPMRVAADQLGPWGLNVPARLEQGVTLQAANEELALLSSQLDLDEGMTLQAVPIREVLLRDDERPLLLLLAAVGFLLVIVSVNIANLLLAESLSRDREFAVRTTLGAGKLRQIRQLLTESLILALLGGFSGLLVAWWVRDLLMPLLPTRVAQLTGGVPMDLRVLGFSLVMVLATTALVGVAPAVRASRRQPQELLQGGKSATRSVASGWMGRAFIVAQVALCLVLLAGAGSIRKDLRALTRLDLGYEKEGLQTLSVALNGEEYSTGPARYGFVEQVAAQMEAIPGVETAASTNVFPSERGNFLAQVEVEGRELRPEETNLVNHRLVSPGFLESMGIPILRGRDLSVSDGDEGLPVVVVSQSLAERYWPGEVVVGKRLRNARQGEDEQWLTVIGVAGNIQEFYETVDTWYLPLAQHAEGDWALRVTFVARASGGSEAIAGQMREAVRSVDPAMAVFQQESASEIYAESLEGQVFATRLTAAFALIGLLVAAIGVYASMAFDVGERSREIAIRMALGGSPRRILLGVLRRGAMLVGLGVGLGLLGSVTLRGWLQELLVGASSAGISTFLWAAFVLSVVGLVAAYLPARRVLQVDPQVELRAE